MCFFLGKMTFSQNSLWENMTFSRNLMCKNMTFSDCCCLMGCFVKYYFINLSNNIKWCLKWQSPDKY